MEPVVLFRTVHGSRLYGLSHADSDYDFYTVLSKVPQVRARYARQRLYDDGTDSFVVDFGTWLSMCEKGVPQALEAMFSTQAEVDHLAAFRAGYRVGTGAWAYYRRTMRNFSQSTEFKRKRHGVRLAVNMHEFREKGFFNPTLTPAEADMCSRVATNLDGDELVETVKSIAFAS